MPQQPGCMDFTGAKDRQKVEAVICRSISVGICLSLQSNFEILRHLADKNV